MFSPIGELYTNLDAPLTRWLVETGAITEFVLVDVGVRGGVHPHWLGLGKALRIYGFDLFPDAIDPLPKNKQSHYFLMALGEKDGEIEVVNDTWGTMMYGGTPPGRKAEKVQVRKLDTLFNSGIVPRADFIKLDCEGFERYVFDGATEYLNACNLLGADAESGFSVSFPNPDSHFTHCQMPLTRQRLVVGDIQMSRVDEKSYIVAAGGEPHPLNVRRPGTINTLFVRDLKGERDSPASYAYRAPEPSPSVETILKTIVVLELYCMIGCAFELLTQFKDRLHKEIDTAKVAGLLVPLVQNSASTMPQDVTTGERVRRLIRRVTG